MKRSISVVDARIRPARIHSLTDSEADRTDPPSLSLRLSRFIFSLSLTHSHSHTLGLFTPNFPQSPLSNQPVLLCDMRSLPGYQWGIALTTQEMCKTVRIWLA